ESGRMRALLEARGAAVRPDAHGRWRVTGPTTTDIGELAREHRIAVHELTPCRSSLEEIYTALTGAAVEYRSTRSADANAEEELSCMPSCTPPSPPLPGSGRHWPSSGRSSPACAPPCGPPPQRPW